MTKPEPEAQPPGASTLMKTVAFLTSSNLASGSMPSPAATGGTAGAGASAAAGTPAGGSHVDAAGSADRVRPQTRPTAVPTTNTNAAPPSESHSQRLFVNFGSGWATM